MVLLFLLSPLILAIIFWTVADFRKSVKDKKYLTILGFCSVGLFVVFMVGYMHIYTDCKCNPEVKVMNYIKESFND